MVVVGGGYHLHSPSSSYFCASFLTETDRHRPRLNSLIDKTQFITTTATSISSSILSAISTPNSILAENTQLDDNFKDGTDALNHETTRPNDQLDISNLCLPQRLIQTLHTQGITILFTIQVSTSLLFPFISLFAILDSIFLWSILLLFF